MKKIIATLSVILLLILFSSNSAQAQFVVRIRPIAPVEGIRPVCPGSHYIWIEGHWHWNRRFGQYQWRRGYWIRERVGHVWVHGYWINRPNGSEWVSGYWR
ncbi:MAG: hypothetical protein ABI199_09150 [Bacteroidia bacterium]